MFITSVSYTVHWNTLFSIIANLIKIRNFRIAQIDTNLLFHNIINSFLPLNTLRANHIIFATATDYLIGHEK